MDKSFLKDIIVLYVEDEDELRQITANILKKFVKKVILATNGLEGLEYFEKHYQNDEEIDLIIADINMPKMDGLTMLEKMQEIDHTIPSVITTAHSDADFLKRAIACKVRGYVTKPLKIDSLIDTIALAAEPRYLKTTLERLNQDLLDKVEETTKELRSILDFQENMILVFDGHKVSSVNKRFLEFFGFVSLEELTDERCVSEYFIQGENYFVPTKKNDWLHEIIKLEDSKRVVRMNSIEGIEKTFRVDVRSFFHNTKHYVVSFTDITQLQEYTYELQFQANHDNLTKLFNRQKFNEELNKEILRENRYQHNLSIIMFDLDDFKKVNDTYGHDVGDVVLMKISQVVKEVTRTTDIVARWGGEEFMILLPETSKNEAQKIAEHIRVSISKIAFAEFEHQITVSLGIAEYIVDKDTKESFLKKVDLALYEAKRGGKNKVVLYEEK